MVVASYRPLCCMSWVPRCLCCTFVAIVVAFIQVCICMHALDVVMTVCPLHRSSRLKCLVVTPVADSVENCCK